MGANPKKTNNRKYYSIVGSDIVEKFDSPQKDGTGKVVTVPREIIDRKTKKVVKTVHEIQLDSLDGLLTDVFIKSHDQYGDSICLVLIDDGKEFQLSIKMDSSYGRNFLFRMPNIDTSMHIELSPYNFEDKDGKKWIGVSVIQKDSEYEKGKVPPYWTKENPGKLPQMEQIQKGSKLVWDSSKRDTYLYNALVKWIEKNFEIAQTAAPNDIDNAAEAVDNVMNENVEFAQTQAAKSSEKTEMEEPEDDDLPF